jgi:RimJ/RimL family protein N-acetyltransferase
MKLRPIHKNIEANIEFASNPLCLETLQMSIDFYNKIGYSPPWIGYYVEVDGQLVGSVGFKGAPKDGSVEIAYATFENFRGKGHGTQMCKLLVDLALKTDSSLQVMARTLPEENHSTQILKKNNFSLKGKVIDQEDGEVWEWVYVSG